MSRLIKKFSCFSLCFLPAELENCKNYKNGKITIATNYGCLSNFLLFGSICFLFELFGYEAHEWWVVIRMNLCIIWLEFIQVEMLIEVNYFKYSKDFYNPWTEKPYFL